MLTTFPGKINIFLVGRKDQVTQAPCSISHYLDVSSHLLHAVDVNSRQAYICNSFAPF